MVGTENMKEYCHSIASQAADISGKMKTKLKDLLLLVVFTVHLESVTLF